MTLDGTGTPYTSDAMNMDTLQRIVKVTTHKTTEGNPRVAIGVVIGVEIAEIGEEEAEVANRDEEDIRVELSIQFPKHRPK